MKKLKLDFQQLNAEVLTRSQLKQILGGVDGSGGTGCYMCCWDSDPTNCSACVQNDGTGPCTKGASLKSCSSPCPYQ